MNALRGAILVLACGACLPADAQTLFKCVQKDGKIRYQDQKCPDDAKETQVQAPGPGPATPPAPVDTSTPAGAAKADAEKNRAADLDAVMDIVASYEGCAQGFPTFTSKFSSAFQAWRTRNAAAVARYEADLEALGKVKKRLVEQKKEFEGDAAAQRCDKVIGPMILRAGTR